MKKESKLEKEFVNEISRYCEAWVSEKLSSPLRGFPDRIAVIRGQFFAFEMKLSKKEAKKTYGRIMLQRHALEAIKAAGGICAFVHPENFVEITAWLYNFANGGTIDVESWNKISGI